MSVKRYSQMHDDHVWDETRGFYACIVTDEEDMGEVLARLNAAQPNPELELKALKVEGLVWGGRSDEL